MVAMKMAAQMLLMGAVFVASFPQGVWAEGISASSVIELVNRSRAAAGLQALSENPKLSQAAKDKAQDMIRNDYFAHTSPKGVTPWSWLKKEGYDSKLAGENLAINFESAKEQHEAWMDSKTHRDNIMNSRYREIGVAVMRGEIDGEEAVVTVQFFGTPAKALDAPAPQISSPGAQREVLPEVKGLEVSEKSVPESAVPTAPSAAGEEAGPSVLTETPVAHSLAQESRGNGLNKARIGWAEWGGIIAGIALDLGLVAGTMLLLARGCGALASCAATAWARWRMSSVSAAPRATDSSRPL
jgi:hypothetical protein